MCRYIKDRYEIQVDHGPCSLICMFLKVLTRYGDWRDTIYFWPAYLVMRESLTLAYYSKISQHDRRRKSSCIFIVFKFMFGRYFVAVTCELFSKAFFSNCDGTMWSDFNIVRSRCLFNNTFFYFMFYHIFPYRLIFMAFWTRFIFIGTQHVLPYEIMQAFYI